MPAHRKLSFSNISFAETRGNVLATFLLSLQFLYARFGLIVVVAFISFKIMFSSLKRIFSSCLSYSGKDHLPIWFFVLLHESFYLIFVTSLLLDHCKFGLTVLFHNIIILLAILFAVHIIFKFYRFIVHFTFHLGIHVHSVRGRVLLALRILP